MSLDELQHKQTPNVRTAFNTPTSANIHSVLGGNSEVTNTRLVHLVSGLPYHSWEGAVNTKRSDLIEGIQEANFQTISEICYTFTLQNEAYWYDTRERCYDGIVEAIENRLALLGYKITSERIYHYLQNSGKRRIMIPTHFEKIETQNQKTTL